MKIAYVTGEYPKASHTFIQREVEILRELGTQVLTCSIRETHATHIVGPDQAEELARTYQVLAASKSPFRLLGSHLTLIWSSPRRWFSALHLAWTTRPSGIVAAIYQLFYLAEAGVLARHLLKEEIEHIHNHFGDSSGSVTMLASEISGIPFSMTIHGPTIFFDVKKWRLDEKVARAKFISCISDFCRSQIMMFSDSKYWSKLKTVHCGIDVEKYRKKAEAKPSANNLLFVGRLAPAKGIPILLDALRDVVKKHPDTHLNIIGDGPDKEDLRASVDSLDLREHVTFHGYRTQEQVADQLQDCDVFVLPSFAEGVPVVLMEAMASGKPVIATRVGGVEELVKDGVHGLVVPPANTKELSQAICTLLEEPLDTHEEMGEAGRRKVESDYNIQREVKKLKGHFL